MLLTHDGYNALPMGWNRSAEVNIPNFAVLLIIPVKLCARRDQRADIAGEIDVSGFCTIYPGVHKVPVSSFELHLC